MEQISIEELTENDFYHFTLISNLDSISIRGLVPQIGENAKGIEKTAKIFMSKGKLAIIKSSEVWLRWLMNRIFGLNDRLKMNKEESQKEQRERLAKWTEEFLTEKFLEDEEKKQKLFQYYYDYVKERTYLTLFLEEKIDFSFDDEDENKVYLKRLDDKMTSQFAKIMYGPFSNFESTKMDDWNMHTFTGITLSPNVIKQVKTPEGKTDMLSILIYLYDKNKNIPHSKFLLDDFVEYAKKRQRLEEMIQEGNNTNDKNDCSRVN